MLRRVLHTGLAVANLEASVAMYGSVGFTLNKKFHKSDIDADVAIVTKGETAFELFEFHNQDHPQVVFIRNHIAFYSDALESDVDELASQGYKLTIPVTEGAIYRFAYVQDKSGTNYEIASDKTKP